MPEDIEQEHESSHKGMNPADQVPAFVAGPVLSLPHVSGTESWYFVMLLT